MANTKLLLAAATILSFGVASANAQPFQKLGNPGQHFSSGHVQMCAGVAPVTVLAVEDQYGSGGGAVPTRLDYQINDNAFIPAFGGGEVSAGMSANLPMGGNGAMLTLKGKIAYPSFGDSQITEAHPHKNPVNVIVLKRGDNLSDVLANKNVEAAYGSQLRIDQILAPYLNGDVVNISPSSTIQLYEFGGITPDSESADYQDLVLKVDYRCVKGQDMLLRNSIGVNNVSTNGNRPFRSDEDINSWRVVAARIDAPADVLLTELRSIVAQYTGGTINWAEADYRIMVWSSLAAFQASPLQGDIANVWTVDDPSYGPTEYGITDSMPLIGVKPTWEMGFDLSPYNLVVPAGTGRYVGLFGLRFFSQFGAGLGIMESTEMGESDWQCGASGCNTIDGGSWSHDDGRVAIELRAQSFH